MKDFLNKLTSRKFLTCVAGVIMGICMVFGLDEGTVNTVSGAVVAVSSVIMYIYTEGKIDAEAVGKIADTVEKIEEAIEEIENVN